MSMIAKKAAGLLHAPPRTLCRLSDMAALRNSRNRPERPKWGAMQLQKSKEKFACISF